MELFISEVELFNSEVVLFISEAVLFNSEVVLFISEVELFISEVKLFISEAVLFISEVELFILEVELFISEAVMYLRGCVNFLCDNILSPMSHSSYHKFAISTNLHGKSRLAKYRQHSGVYLCISQFQAWPSPRAKPLGNCFDGRISQPPGKKGVQNPHPRACKNELKPHPRGIFLNYSL